MLRVQRSTVFLFACLLVVGWCVGVVIGSADAPSLPWERTADTDTVPTHIIVHKTPPPPPPLPATCSDADGDGYSPDGGECGLIDCDDFDPDVNPGAPDVCDGIDNDCDGAIEERFVASDGTEYCYDFLFGDAIVGQPIPVRAYGYASSGQIVFDLLPIDSSYVGKMHHNCYPGSYCVWDTELPAHNYPGMHPVEGWFEASGTMAFAHIVQYLEIECPDEYCEPEPIYVDFVTWMREKGYKESIVNLYADIRLDMRSQAYRRNLRNGPKGITQPLVVDFYDLIPTDSEATWVGMDIGEGPDCVSSRTYPDYCSTVKPVDYKFMEAHFEQTFGIDMEFVYHRVEMDYTDVLGDPELLDYGWYRFPFPYDFRSSFPQHAIVHFAMTRWLGTQIDGTTTGAGAAFIQRDLDNLLIATVFTHEWGHTWSVSHSFFGAYPNMEFWGLNGVMDNTYRSSPSPVYDITDPLERYLFEPDGGYADDATFADFYNNYIIGTLQMPDCHLVEPEILALTVIAETATDITYRLTLGNLGNTAVNFVPLAAFDGDGFGALIEERIIDRIEPGVNITHDFTVDKSMLTSDSAVFVLDKDDMIAEMNEHPDIACVNPISCGDLNNSGDVNVSDLIVLVNYVFKSGSPPFPSWIADLNGLGDGVTTADIIYLVNYIFRGGNPPLCAAPAAL